jgi:hypothetical protein
MTNELAVSSDAPEDTSAQTAHGCTRNDECVGTWQLLMVRNVSGRLWGRPRGVWPHPRLDVERSGIRRVAKTSDDECRLDGGKVHEGWSKLSLLSRRGQLWMSSVRVLRAYVP